MDIALDKIVFVDMAKAVATAVMQRRNEGWRERVTDIIEWINLSIINT